MCRPHSNTDLNVIFTLIFGSLLLDCDTVIQLYIVFVMYKAIPVSLDINL